LFKHLPFLITNQLQSAVERYTLILGSRIVSVVVYKYGCYHSSHTNESESISINCNVTINQTILHSKNSVLFAE